ncbi:O-antigen ligase family protein [Arthrobacter sp. LjRoot14]|uniref:O-antigen ligase family protein n=1 Tax=Arthrobacter sp. LjRoot14 TaxID=3342265 RepID=UPI003ED096AD
MASVSVKYKLVLIFVLNACLLVVANRQIAGIDIAALLSMLTAGLAAFGVTSNRRPADTTITSSSGNRYFDIVTYLLVGFVVFATISTMANSQRLTTLVPWVNGAAVALLVARLPSSYLPSFANARRAVIVAGGLTVIYDLYLLAAGKALNTGPFNAGRFVGSLGDYELLAEFYGAIILLGLTAIFFDRSRIWRATSGIVIVPSFLILLATQSRGPILLLCVVAPVLILISAFQFREAAGKIFAVVAGLALAFGVFMGTLSATPLFERLSSIQLGGSIESTLNRASVWDYFTQLPQFVNTGILGNGFEFPYDAIGTFPHSLYLWLLWSGGLISLTSFGLLVSILLCKLMRGIFLRHSASLSAAAIFVFMLLDEVKIEAARTSPTVGFLWVVLSLAILASREQRES